MPKGGYLILHTQNVTENEMGGQLYSPKEGSYVKLTVTDTGLGMDDDTQKRIFDPFFTSKEMGGGTGLGLASVYGIIKSHGGYVDVDSEEGQGTTFSIYLPASNTHRQDKNDSNKCNTEGGTILLVDDEEMVLDIGAKLMKMIGHQVYEAKSGREALEIYKENSENIDLVILDMIMPDMGGGEVFDKIKQVDENAKVLLSSGYSIEGEASQILERGCNGFIQKPFSVKHVSAKINEILAN